MAEKLVRNHRDLEVYQQGFEVSIRIFELTKNFPIESAQRNNRDTFSLPYSPAPYLPCS